MTKTTAEIPGLPEELIKVIGSLPCENLIPTWSVRHTNGVYSVRIAWKPKHMKPPLKTPACMERHPQPKQNRNAVDRKATVSLEHHPTDPSPASTIKKPDRRKKKKSPSARRRDLQRLMNWKTKRQSAKPVTTPVPLETPAEHRIEHQSALPTELVHKAKSEDKVGGRESCLDQYAATDSDDSVSVDKDNQDDSFSDLDPGGLCCTCLKPASEVAGGLKKCTRCKFTQYCGRTCQTRDWINHRHLCSEFAAMYQ